LYEPNRHGGTNVSGVDFFRSLSQEHLAEMAANLRYGGDSLAKAGHRYLIGHVVDCGTMHYGPEVYSISTEGPSYLLDLGEKKLKVSQSSPLGRLRQSLLGYRAYDVDFEGAASLSDVAVVEGGGRRTKFADFMGKDIRSMRDVRRTSETGRSVGEKIRATLNEGYETGGIFHQAPEGLWHWVFRMSDIQMVHKADEAGKPIRTYCREMMARPGREYMTRDPGILLYHLHPPGKPDAYRGDFLICGKLNLRQFVVFQKEALGFRGRAYLLKDAHQPEEVKHLLEGVQDSFKQSIDVIDQTARDMFTTQDFRVSADGGRFSVQEI